MDNCYAEIKRLVYENNVAKSKTTIFSCLGYLTAINEESKLMGDGKFGKLFKLSITSLVDIRESDSIVIDGSEYSVKGVAKRNCGGLCLTNVILEKGV